MKHAAALFRKDGIVCYMSVQHHKAEGKTPQIGLKSEVSLPPLKMLILGQFSSNNLLRTHKVLRLALAGGPSELK